MKEVRGVSYRCIAGAKLHVAHCGTSFCDPECTRTFSSWEAMVRSHFFKEHGMMLPADAPINDFLEPVYSC